MGTLTAMTTMATATVIVTGPHKAVQHPSLAALAVPRDPHCPVGMPTRRLAVTAMGTATITVMGMKMVTIMRMATQATVMGMAMTIATMNQMTLSRAC